jgi:hypothetical protein
MAAGSWKRNRHQQDSYSRVRLGQRQYKKGLLTEVNKVWSIQRKEIGARKRDAGTYTRELYMSSGEWIICPLNLEQGRGRVIQDEEGK